MPERRSGPVLLSYDGSADAEHTIRRAGSLLGGRPAIVLHVATTAADAIAESGRRVAREAGFGPVSVAARDAGAVANVIVAEAQAADAAVIVVGSRAGSRRDPTTLGRVSSRVAHRATRPVLVVGSGPGGDAVHGPVFLCYDESESARQAVATAARLLAGRDAIVASFLPRVDDDVVLRRTLPWPRSRVVREELAALDRGEALGPADVAAHGVELARRDGLNARSVPIDGDGVAWRHLGEAAAAHRAACIVVGHRPPAGVLAHLGGTVDELVQHADRPVLVVPAR